MAKILLTGRPGAGKTTLVRKVADRPDALAGGIVTEEVREAGRRTGFRVTDVLSGESGVLAHVDRRSGPRVGKYRVDVPSFERTGVAALEAALERDGLIVIDEIGKMELCSDAFCSVVERVFDAPHPVLATIPRRRPPFVKAIARHASAVRELTEANPDGLADELLGALGAGP